MQARATWRSALLCLAAIGGLAGACSTVLDLDGYAVRPIDAGSLASDAAPAGSLPGRDGAGDVLDGGAACDSDPAVTCYPCAPTTEVQFLNACTSAACVPFDDKVRLTNLLPDGALPPLPPLASPGAHEAGGQ